MKQRRRTRMGKNGVKKALREEWPRECLISVDKSNANWDRLTFSPLDNKFHFFPNSRHSARCHVVSFHFFLSLFLSPSISLFVFLGFVCGHRIQYACSVHVASCLVALRPSFPVTENFDKFHECVIRWLALLWCFHGRFLRLPNERPALRDDTANLSSAERRTSFESFFIRF